MKTQLSILVKDSMSTFNPLMSIFTKTKVSMFIDGNKANPIVLQVSKTPHLIDVVPGNHHIEFTYNNILAKIAFGLYDVVFDLMSNGLFGGVASAVGGTNKTYDNVLDCYLNDGDMLRLEVKPKASGKVKIKIY